MNLPLGTQGRSWWLDEGHPLQSKKRRTQEGLVPRSPAGLCRCQRQSSGLGLHTLHAAEGETREEQQQRAAGGGGQGRWPPKAGEDRHLPSLPPSQSRGSYRTTRDSGWGARPMGTPLPNPKKRDQEGPRQREGDPVHQRVGPLRWPLKDSLDLQPVIYSLDKEDPNCD